jgi:PP-loop superfamily ATP-utilizing enzyme
LVLWFQSSPEFFEPHAEIDEALIVKIGVVAVIIDAPIGRCAIDKKEIPSCFSCKRKEMFWNELPRLER